MKKKKTDASGQPWGSKWGNSVSDPQDVNQPPSPEHEQKWATNSDFTKMDSVQQLIVKQKQEEKYREIVFENTGFDINLFLRSN